MILLNISLTSRLHTRGKLALHERKNESWLEGKFALKIEVSRGPKNFKCTKIMLLNQNKLKLPYFICIPHKIP